MDTMDAGETGYSGESWDTGGCWVNSLCCMIETGEACCKPAVCHLRCRVAGDS